MSALEAYVNSISEELCDSFELDTYEKALLSESEIKINNGNIVISNGLKMYRLIDRIELIYCKYSKEKILGSEEWNMGIKQAIELRNCLVHPKQMLRITYSQVERALKSILETVNKLFLAVYKQNVPIYNYGLQAICIE